MSCFELARGSTFELYCELIYQFVAMLLVASPQGLTVFGESLRSRGPG